MAKRVALPLNNKVLGSIPRSCFEIACSYPICLGLRLVIRFLPTTPKACKDTAWPMIVFDINLSMHTDVTCND